MKKIHDYTAKVVQLSDVISLRHMALMIGIELIKWAIFAAVSNIIITEMGQTTQVVTFSIIMVFVVWLLDYILKKVPNFKGKRYVGTFRTTLMLVCLVFIIRAFTMESFSYEKLHSSDIINSVWIMLLLDQVAVVFKGRLEELKKIKVWE